MQPYTKDFFKSVDEESLRSARAFVPLVMDLIQPKRVIDLGCGWVIGCLYSKNTVLKKFWELMVTI
jgi:hypothetical protein